MASGQAALLGSRQARQNIMIRHSGWFSEKLCVVGLTGGELGTPKSLVGELSGSSRGAWYKLWELTRTGRVDIEIPVGSRDILRKPMAGVRFSCFPSWPRTTPGLE